MSDWSHGYNVSLAYTYGFYRELAPEWLDLCVRIAGFVPPSRAADGGYRYLELGSGQGVGLCLLAAANPEAEFVGVDFNPEHIAHSRALVESGKLTNIRFIEGDFDVLGAEWPADLGQFDYIVLHGIYSWVPPLVRRALVACLDQALVSGGLVYNSYNTKPGWLTTMPFQHLARRMQVVTNKTGPEAIDATVALFDQLAESNAAMFQALPGLKGRVNSVKTQNRNYLVQEYLHEQWHPLWFSEVAEEFGGAKLNYVGSATAAELLLPGPLSKETRALIDSQPDPVLKQELQDCAINQLFRRDIFCRGGRKAFQRPFQAAMGTVFHLIAAPKPEPLKVQVSFGELGLNHDIFGGVIDALQTGPKTLAELLAQPSLAGRSPANGIQTILMLLQSGAIGVGRQSYDPTIAQAFNTIVVHAVCQGAPYGFLAMPALAAALPASDIDCMMLDVLIDKGKPNKAALGAGVHARLASLGRTLSHAGERLEGEALDKRIEELVEIFVNTQVPKFRSLGAIA